MIVGELQWKLACFAAGLVTKLWWLRLSASQANGKHILVVGYVMYLFCFRAQRLPSRLYKVFEEFL